MSPAKQAHAAAGLVLFNQTAQRLRPFSVNKSGDGRGGFLALSVKSPERGASAESWFRSVRFPELPVSVMGPFAPCVPSGLSSLCCSCAG